MKTTLPSCPAWLCCWAEVISHRRSVGVRPGCGARYLPPHYRPYPGMSVSLEVVSDGRTMSTIQHGDRTYLPVPCWGEEYSLRITNNGPRRIAAVVSVDGLSVITGKPASEGDAGYRGRPQLHHDQGLAAQPGSGGRVFLRGTPQQLRQQNRPAGKRRRHRSRGLRGANARIPAASAVGGRLQRRKTANRRRRKEPIRLELCPGPLRCRRHGHGLTRH